jgi:hypothetical protein
VHYCIPGLPLFNLFHFHWFSLLLSECIFSFSFPFVKSFIFNLYLFLKGGGYWTVCAGRWQLALSFHSPRKFLFHIGLIRWNTCLSLLYSRSRLL